MCLAVPGRVVSLGEAGPAQAGTVDFDGLLKQVSFACLPDVQVGDFVVTHLGMAIDRLDEQDAERLRADLTRLRESGPAG
jgi:hydrogenase expression/formation protein HypC